ncbi:Quinone oxidoreductase [Acidisarcina polymorpha]|uniref:Quinone oxidoreductase n=1 Tax=Acidisarcina polymorpha TaxID=2211140 RepID=A0A2Z5GAB4_9BACT|nr:NADPH:quinone reductase [Acidisarcina polymorpha]AXC15807.1 Quinone oxidoreductase [Acidisarcina polymorpha]
MRAAWYERNRSARDVLIVGELAKPALGPGKVLVRVHAAGVNPSDTKRRARAPLLPGNKQQIPHQDGAGVIEEIGEGVSASRLGQRVWIYEALVAGKAGCAAQYVAVPSGNAVPLPSSISFETGACLGVPALTAHRCVFADGPVTGKTLLVTGGAGSVGVHAIQFAKAAGARVFTTVSRPEQALIAKDAGADLVIDRHKEDVVARIQETANNAGAQVVDRVIDVAFGQTLPFAVKLLKVGGVIATYSSDARPEPTIPFLPLLFLDATIRFVNVYMMSREAHESAIEAVMVGLREGWLKPTIASRFSLDQIVAAHEASESGKSVGKIVVLLD